MQYLHTMIRVQRPERLARLFFQQVRVEEVRRIDNEAGRFTLVFLAAPEDLELARDRNAPLVELTYQLGSEDYTAAAISAISPTASTTSTRSATS